MAKKLFYVCGGRLMLALSYHLGAPTAAQQQMWGQVEDRYRK
jgi:hypothetical protein